MIVLDTGGKYQKSPSMRREWIEIPLTIFLTSIFPTSPSMRREWIEMHGAAHMGRC